MTQQVIPFDHIQVTKSDEGFLGSGSYAKVRLAVWRGAQVAVKELHSVFFESGGCSEWESSFVEAFLAECDMLAQLRHPNVVQFFGVVLQSSGLPLLVTELMRESLQDRMRRSPALKTSEVIAVSHDVANALDYIHGLEKPIAHRDLAPKNILLEYNPEIRAKIADLGVAKVMSCVDPQSVNTRRPGTDSYMPPEAFVNGQYTLNIDVFSLGVIMLQMVVGREPTPSSMWRPCGSGTFRMVPESERRQRDLNDIPGDHPLRSLILQCLENERPSAHDIADSIRRVVEAVGGDRSMEYVPAWKIKEVEDANKKKVEMMEKECQETVDLCHCSLTAVIDQLQKEKESLKHEKQALQKTAEELQASLDVVTKHWHEETSTLHDNINSKAVEIGTLQQERDDFKHQLELEKDQRRTSEHQQQTDFLMRVEASVVKAKLDKERELAQVRSEMEGKHMTMLESLMAENEAAFARSRELCEKERTEDQEQKTALTREVASLKIELETVKRENAALQKKLSDAAIDSSETDRLKKQQDASYKAAMNLVRNEQRSAIKAVQRGFEAQKKKEADDFQCVINTLRQGHKAREEELKNKLAGAEHKISILEGLLDQLRQQVSWPVRGIML